MVDQGRVSTLTGCLTAASPLRHPVADLHRGWGLVKGMIRLGTNCAATRPMEKNAARSAHAPLKNVAAVRGSWLKIATDVASMLESSKAQQKRGRLFSLAGMEIDSAQRGIRSS